PRNRSGRNLLQAGYNASVMSIAAGLSSLVFVDGAAAIGAEAGPILVSLLSGVLIFLAFNTVLTAMAISLSENMPFLKAWTPISTYSFPYYCLSGSIAALSLPLRMPEIWVLPVLLALMGVVHLCYRRNFERS